MQFRLSLLGPFGICSEAQAVNRFESAKVCALLAYLAAEAGQPQARSKLAGLLWPDYPEKSANQSLRQALYSLRKLLDEDKSQYPIIQAERSQITFVPDQDCEIDTLELDHCLTESAANPTRRASIQKLELAVSQVRGVFLEDFLLDDSPAFEEWILNRREYYTQQLLKAHNVLCHWYEENEAFVQAEQHARRQLELEPWKETACQQFMRLLAKQGKRAEALKKYDQLKCELKESLGVGPSQATNLLYEQIKTGEFEQDVIDSAVGLEPVYAGKPRHNLPLELTSFIGREVEIEHVRTLLLEHRLVTLTGVGGTGKTRLALRAVESVLEDFPNGAWFVELAQLADPDMVPKTVSSTLGLLENPGKLITDSLVDFLESRRLLLVLDNCEHLLSACASLVDRILHTCPGVTVLATSREILGVMGEVPFLVPPLSMPDVHALLFADSLCECDAVRLFVERARVVSPGFELSDENARVVVEIVRRLDGIPLAIELAAARMRLLGVEQIAQRLGDAFRLLTGGARTALPRHQALRASIDWSYNLLSEPERILLRRLSVFAGSWSLGAAEVVCADEPGPAQLIQPVEILDQLSELVDKSLISTISSADGRNRFRMLETVRQYAHEKLVDEGEAEVMRTRHLGYYLALAEELEPKIRSREQIQTLDRLTLELDNIRLALEWGLQADIEAQLRLTAAIIWFWHIRFHWSESIDWSEKGLAAEKETQTGPQDSLPALVRAKALMALWYHRQMKFGPDAQMSSTPLLEESLAIYNSLSLDQPPEIFREIKQGRAWVILHLHYHPPHGKEEVLEALGLFRQIKDHHGIAESLQVLGLSEKDPVRRMDLHQEQLAVQEANGDVDGIASALWQFGIAAHLNADYGKARTSCDASIAQIRLVDNPNLEASSRLVAGIASTACGDYQRANEYISEGLAMSIEVGHERLSPIAFMTKSWLRIAQGSLNQAEELSAEIWRYHQKTGSNATLAQSLYIRSRLARLRGEFVPARKYAEEMLNITNIEPQHKMLALLELGCLALQDGDLKGAGKL